MCSAFLFMGYQALREKTLVVTKEPLAGNDFLNLLRLLAQNHYKVDFPYIPRVLYSLLLSLLISPFRVMERYRFDTLIDQTKIEHHPLFLLGHWRGGTTYLHNVLSHDKQFGFVSTFHALLPGAFLGFENVFKSLVSSSLPSKRPMDDVAMGADLPQEDEYAVGGLSPYSYYHGWCFPRNMMFYNRFVCFDSVPRSVIDEWKKVYLYLVKKETVHENGRRLLLKNPANTARVKLLLELFPDAKFVHIQRNPHHQYLSMVRFMQIVIPLYCVQVPPSFEQIDEIMMDLYVKMYRKYFQERNLIPEGNLIEIRYEDFIANPLAETRKIYEHLGLNGFSNAEHAIRAYLLTQSEIRTHTYVVSDEVREKVSSKWGFAFKEFGYEM